MLINFLVAGVQKAGTTAIYSYLFDHPELCFSWVKEVHYFDNEKLFSSVFGNRDWYHSNFPNPKGRIVGEVTPIYFFWNSVADRVLRYNPEMKWIVILRDPVSRAYSHWNMERNRGTEVLSFREAVNAELAYISNMGFQCRVRSYLSRGWYSCQINRLRKNFSDSQLLFLKYDNFLLNPIEFLNDICRFLGVSCISFLEEKRANVISYEKHLSESDWNYVIPYFLDDIKIIESELAWDCSSWKTWAPY